VTVNVTVIRIKKTFSSKAHETRCSPKSTYGGYNSMFIIFLKTKIGYSNIKPKKNFISSQLILSRFTPHHQLTIYFSTTCKCFPAVRDKFYANHEGSHKAFLVLVLSCKPHKSMWGELLGH